MSNQPPPEVAAAFKAEAMRREQLKLQQEGAAPNLPPGAIEIKDPAIVAINAMLQETRQGLSKLFGEMGQHYAMLSFCRDELQKLAVESHEQMVAGQKEETPDEVPPELVQSVPTPGVDTEQ